MKTGILKNEKTEPGEVEHLYRDIDKIRLVYEDLGGDIPQLVGWYRPGECDAEPNGTER